MRSSPRSVHLCNLANVAYGYCKILREEDSDVWLNCHDLKHLMSQPEWDDLELRAEDFPDEFDFFNNKHDFGDYRRPSWFSNAGIFPEDQDMSVGGDEATSSAGVPTAAVAAPKQRVSERARALWLQLPSSTRRILKSRLRTAEFVRGAMGSPLATAQSLREYRDLATRNIDTIVTHSKTMAPEHHVTEDMVGAFIPHAWWAQRHSRAVDVVMAYVLTPIYTMILGDRPYVSIEIGTMRDIPFDQTDTGRLLANAYAHSDHVLITNPDVRAQAEELGLDSYSFCPHPLDEDVYRRSESGEFRAELEARYNCSQILFAPARQNWDVKGNDVYLRAFAELRAHRSGVGLIIPGWGQEVERSQRYCETLGIADAVHWIPPQSEAALVKYYNAADIVLDQFVLGVFGLTSPKAMAASAVVVTSYDPGLHEWAFDEHPPLVPASEPSRIGRQLIELLDRPDYLLELGEQSRLWVERHHSKAVVRQRLDEAMAIAQERYDARSQRWAIVA